MSFPKLSSKIWNFFTINAIDESKANCDVCNEKLTRGGANARSYRSDNRALKNGTRFVPGPANSTSKYSDLVPGRKCLPGWSLDLVSNISSNIGIFLAVAYYY